MLGWYVSHLRNKVKMMSTDVEKKAKTISELATSVENTEKMIHKDLHGLYLKLRKEETMELLRRLEEEPLDIHNLSTQLLSREIDDKGYEILRNAYRKLEITGQADKVVGFSSSYRGAFLLLFFQHFMFHAIQDNELRPHLSSFFRTGFSCAFQRDILKTTRDLCRAMTDDSCKFNREEVLVQYLKAMQDSQYKTLGLLKDILEDEFKKTSVLVDSIEKCREEGVYLEMFGVSSPDVF